MTSAQREKLRKLQTALDRARDDMDTAASSLEDANEALDDLEIELVLQPRKRRGGKP